MFEQAKTTIRLAVYSLPTACIGRYKLNVVTNCPAGKATSPDTPENGHLHAVQPLVQRYYLKREKIRGHCGCLSLNNENTIEAFSLSALIR